MQESKEVIAGRRGAAARLKNQERTRGWPRSHFMILTGNEQGLN